MIKNDESHVICLLKDTLLAIQGATSHDTQPRFQQDKQLQPLLFAFQSFHYQFNVAQNPYDGLTQVYVVYAGYVIVKFVAIADILAAGDNLATMSAFLEKQTHACFERHGTLGVAAGSSFYVPFGFVALYIGIPSKDNDEAFENATIISHVILDDGYTRVSNAVAIEIKSWVSGGLARECNINTNFVLLK